MTRSLDVLKEIYKPLKYTIKGKITILETTSGNFLIKEKANDLKGLYTYLQSRSFNYFPKLIDNTRKDVNVFEFIEDTDMPREQKAQDLISLISLLHNKTSYFKEVSEDVYKEIYEILKYIPKNELAKLPNGFMKFIEKKMDKSYTYKVEFVQDFEKQPMLKETRTILAILYRDYWATPQKKQEILERDKKQIKEKLEADRKKYDIDTILAKQKEQTKSNEPKLNEIVPYKESLLSRIKNKIKSWFKFWR